MSARFLFTIPFSNSITVCTRADSEDGHKEFRLSGNVFLGADKLADNQRHADISLSNPPDIREDKPQHEGNQRRADIAQMLADCLQIS